MDRQALRETLVDLLEQETWERPESLDDSISLRDGLKLDSVDLLTVMMRIESQLGFQLNNHDLEPIVTLGDLLDLIQAKLAAKAQGHANARAA
jgi:acyl carrier protein